MSNITYHEFGYRVGLYNFAVVSKEARINGQLVSSPQSNEIQKDIGTLLDELERTGRIPGNRPLEPRTLSILDNFEKSHGVEWKEDRLWQFRISE